MPIERAFVGIALPMIALLFAALTGALLIADLKQPRRFYYIFTRPQWGSWLVRGAFILLGYGVLASLWLLAGLIDSPGMIQAMAIPAVAVRGRQRQATQRSCSASARAAISGRHRCCCRPCWPKPGPPGPVSDSSSRHSSTSLPTFTRR